MLDYKSIVKLKKLGLNNSAISNSLHFKWETIQRVISRCENIWGSIDGVPDDLSNEEIADLLFTNRKSTDLSYLQIDCEEVLEKQWCGFQRNELWAEYCAKAASKGKNAYMNTFHKIEHHGRTG